MKSHLLPILFLSLISLTGVGCTPKIIGLRADQTFTWPSLSNGQISIGGVTSLTGDVSDSDRSSYSELLKSQIIDQMHELNVSPVGVVINQLGNEKYTNLIHDYQTSGEVSEPWLLTLKNKLSGRKYIAFARIESDHTTTNRVMSQDTDKVGNIIPGSRTYRSDVTRTVNVKMDIYDLVAGKSVWSGSHANSSTKSNTYSNERDDHPLVGLIKAATNTVQSLDEKYPYPAAPQLSVMLSGIFRGFVKNFPKPE